MPNYTDADKVAAKIGWIDDNDARVVPDNSGDMLPSLIEINNTIDDMESYIEDECNMSWKATTVTDEMHSNYRRRIFYLNGFPVQLRNFPIQASGLTKLEVWNGSSWIDLVATGTEGDGIRDGDYFVDYKIGKIWINNTYPTWGENTIKVTYNWGKATVPNVIRRCATLLAAAELLDMGFDWTNEMNPTEGLISYGEKVKTWREQAEKIIERHVVSPQLNFYS